MDTNQQQPNPDNQGLSDTQKLVNLHLSDPNHVITEEEMKKLRVGMTSTPDEPTRQAVKDAEDRIADKKSDSEDDTLPGSQKMTPWNVIE